MSRDAAPPTLAITIDARGTDRQLRRFWRSTGFTPAELLLDPDMEQQLAYLAALPRHAVEYVRIHYLFNLLAVERVGTEGPVYDWDRLDQAMDRLVGFGFRPIFELMGNPSEHFTDFTDRAQLGHWRDLVAATARRYGERFGRAELRAWFFETWNEPDLPWWWPHGEAAFNNYYDACAAGLWDVDEELKLGGPGTARTLSPLFQSFMAHVDGGTNHFTGAVGQRLDFISVHEKGARPSREDLTPRTWWMVEREAEAIEHVRRYHPRLAALPFWNDESDPQVGWSDVHTWHGRPYYAALACRMVGQHLSRLADAMGVDYGMLSNDHGFIGGWGQRSILAIFGGKAQVLGQGEHRTVVPRNLAAGEHPPFALVKKPIFTAMGFLAQLDGARCAVEFSVATDAVGTLAARREDGTIAVLVWHSVDHLARSGSVAIELAINGVAGAGEWLLTHHRIDEAHGDPFRLWEEWEGPAEPSAEQLAILRDHQEPVLLAPAQHLAPNEGRVALAFDLPLPGVSLILLTPKGGTILTAPQKLTARRFRGLHGADEILLSWQHVAVPALKSYEVLGAASAAGPFARINPPDLLDAAYLVTRDVRHFRVRATDHWGNVGPQSETLSI